LTEKKSHSVSERGKPNMRRVAGRSRRKRKDRTERR